MRVIEGLVLKVDGVLRAGHATVFLLEEVELNVEEKTLEHEIQFWHDDYEDAMEALREAVSPELAAAVVDEDIDPLRISDHLTAG